MVRVSRNIFLILNFPNIYRYLIYKFPHILYFYVQHRFFFKTLSVICVKEGVEIHFKCVQSRYNLLEQFCLLAIFHIFYDMNIRFETEGIIICITIMLNIGVFQYIIKCDYTRMIYLQKLSFLWKYKSTNVNLGTANRNVYLTGSEELLTGSEEFLIGLANLQYFSGDLQRTFSKLQM